MMGNTGSQLKLAAYYHKLKARSYDEEERMGFEDKAIYWYELGRRKFYRRKILAGRRSD